MTEPDPTSERPVATIERPRMSRPRRHDKQVMKYVRKTVLHRDLTGLQLVPATATTNTAALTRAVTTWSDIQLKANAANEKQKAEDAAPTTVNEKFCQLCDVTHEDYLPASWTGIAGKKKGQNDLRIMQMITDKNFHFKWDAPYMKAHPVIAPKETNTAGVKENRLMLSTRIAAAVIVE